MAATTRDVPRAWSAAIALLVFAGYLALAPPVSGDKDSAEFTLALALNGVAHPTGYPLFTLLGHAWVTVLHRLGATWAYAANAWTALGGACGIYFLQRLALAFLAPLADLRRRARFGLSILPAALLAFNPIWTYETTLAEVYAWHVAWALGTAVSFLWLMRRIDRAHPGGMNGRAALWGLLCGIGAAHHATSVFVVLPLSLAVIVALLRRRLLRVTHVLAAISASCLPLSSYGFILWRASHPVGVPWPWLRPGLGGLLEHVTGHQYVGRLGSFTPSPPQAQLMAEFLWPFLVPGLVLLAVYAYRSRSLAVRTIAAAAFAGTIYGFSYGVPDPSSYFLYPLAFGLAALAPLLGPGLARGMAAARLLAWLAAALALWLTIPWLGMSATRSLKLLSFDGRVASMWRKIPYERGYVFWNDDMYYKLFERQLLDHEKPGLRVVNANVLIQPEPRRKFMEREGFDPFPGRSLAPANVVEESMNRQTTLPVMHFDPIVGTVQLWEKSDSAATPPAPPARPPAPLR